MQRSNGLYKLAGGSAVLVGAFLVMGALGHFQAVLSVINEAGDDVNGFTLLLPGVILAVAGFLSASFCKVLWDGRQWAVDVALTSNALALVYLLYLLWKGVPGHPVAMFTGIVACNLLLLVVTRAGLVWPAEPSMSADAKEK